MPTFLFTGFAKAAYKLAYLLFDVGFSSLTKVAGDPIVSQYTSMRVILPKSTVDVLIIFIESLLHNGLAICTVNAALGILPFTVKGLLNEATQLLLEVTVRDTV